MLTFITERIGNCACGGRGGAGGLEMEKFGLRNKIKIPNMARTPSGAISSEPKTMPTIHCFSSYK